MAGIGCNSVQRHDPVAATYGQQHTCGHSPTTLKLHHGALLVPSLVDNTPSVLVDGKVSTIQDGTAKPVLSSLCQEPTRWLFSLPFSSTNTIVCVLVGLRCPVLSWMAQSRRAKKNGRNWRVRQRESRCATVFTTVNKITVQDPKNVLLLPCP